MKDIRDANAVLDDDIRFLANRTFVYSDSIARIYNFIENEKLDENLINFANNKGKISDLEWEKL